MPVLFNLIVLALSLSSIQAAKILAVFPIASISHQVVFRPITQELARRGHEVTVITPDPAFPKGQTPGNLTEIDVHDLSYDMWTETVKTMSKGFLNEVEQMEAITRAVHTVFDAQLQTKEIQEVLKSKEKYDLLILEAGVRPALAFTHVFKAPTVLISSCGAAPAKNLDIFGVSEHPILYPSFVRRRLYNLSMWEKFSEIYGHFQMKLMFEKLSGSIDEILQKNFGPSVPSIEQLTENVDMLMLNVDRVFAGNMPVPPNVIFLGGLHQKPEKPLPTDLKQYLDSSKNGVIYVSFGTNIDPTLFSTERVQTLVNVFSKLPYDVLFKWNKDELPGRTDNIKIAKWLPQSDLLRHPKVKAFITQGGLQSTDEAITAGVPLIGMPMMVDQWYNVEKYVYFGIGVQLDLSTFTEETLRNAIDKVVGDGSYRRNAAKLRTLIEDQPMRPLERAIWWIEYVIRNKGAKHLRSPGANISWAQYLELELVCIVLAALSLVLVVFTSILYSLYKYFFSPVSIKVKSN